MKTAGIALIGLLCGVFGEVAVLAQPPLEVLRPNAFDRLQPGDTIRFEWRIFDTDLGRGRDWNFFLETNSVHIGRIFTSPQNDGNGRWHAYVTIPNEVQPFSRWDTIWVELPSSCHYTLRIHEDGSEADASSGIFCLGVPELAIKTMTPSQVDICWGSRSNRAYQVQFRSALTSTSWTNLGSPVQGTGTNNCVTDSITPSRSQRFYRVQEMP